MRRLLASAILLLIPATVAVADDASCIASPTCHCLLGMAAQANVAAGKIVSRSNTDNDANARSLVVAHTWGDIFELAAKTEDVDFALSVAPSVSKQSGTLGIPELITALKLAGRDADLASLLKQLGYDDQIADMVFGPALVASARTADFRAASRNYEPYNIVAMEAAGNFLAGKPTEGLALIDAPHGSFRKAAGVNTLAILQGTGHGDVATLLVQYQDLGTVNGVEACALVAQATKDKALAEKCLAAASPLSEAAARDHAFSTPSHRHCGAWRERRPEQASYRSAYLRSAGPSLHRAPRPCAWRAVLYAAVRLRVMHFFMHGGHGHGGHGLSARTQDGPDRELIYVAKIKMASRDLRGRAGSVIRWAAL